MKKYYYIFISVAGILLMFNLFKSNLVSETQEQHEEPKKLVAEEYEKLINDPKLRRATVTGGCFWCMEGPFEQLEGVEEVISGYSGGDIENPDYMQVVSGKTKYREAVQIFYYPEKVTFKELLDIYWYQIDPTDAGGQFADRGYQYTTAIYYNDDEEKAVAEASLKELEDSKRLEGSVVTEILPYKNFVPAEDYHQDFYLHSAERYKIYKNLSGRQGYIESQEN